MESSIKDKYIILGFVGFAIVLISSIATLVIADSFNQDNFVRWIVFVCCNLLGWLLYLSFQTLYLQPIITQYFIDNKSEIWLLFLIAHSKR